MFLYKYSNRKLIREKLNKFFEIPIIKILNYFKIKPNHISILGLVLAFISAYFISNSNFILSPIFYYYLVLVIYWMVRLQDILNL